MANRNLSELTAFILRQNKVTANDILALRRTLYRDGVISVQEADRIFEINSLGDKTSAWDGLFVETICDFLVRQTPPFGYINEGNAAWLLARINHDGVVETRTELELLLRVMKVASNVTESIERFAIEQVKHAVLNGRGALAGSPEFVPGVMGEAEVDVLRRALYAKSSEGGIGITQMEAEALFDINDIVRGRGNHPSWQFLFTRGIANHLMMLAAWNEPDLQTALAKEQWLDQRTSESGFRNFSPQRLAQSFKALLAPKEITYSILDSAAVKQAERIDAAEAYWLLDRIGRDGELDSNEQALLAFLRAECPDMHQSLTAAIG